MVTYHKNLRLSVKTLLLNSEQQFLFQSKHLIQNINHLLIEQINSYLFNDVISKQAAPLDV